MGEAKTGEDQPGALFSRVYLSSATVQRDSSRFRTRVQSWFLTELHETDHLHVYTLIRRELGITPPFDAFGTAWGLFFANAEIRDILDTLSFIFRVAVARTDIAKGREFRAFVTRVFQEESLGYVMDEKGGVRFGVDAEYERNRFSMIDGLGDPRYAAVLTAAESAFKRLDGDGADTKAAVREMFEAARSWEALDREQR